VVMLWESHEGAALWILDIGVVTSLFATDAPVMRAGAADVKTTTRTTCRYQPQRSKYTCDVLPPQPISVAAG
jgi:hypothetical protein